MAKKTRVTPSQQMTAGLQITIIWILLSIYSVYWVVTNVGEGGGLIVFLAILSAWIPAGMIWAALNGLYIRLYNLRLRMRRRVQQS